MHDINCGYCGIDVAPLAVEYDEDFGEEYATEYPKDCPDCGETLDLDCGPDYTGMDERRQLGMSWF